MSQPNLMTLAAYNITNGAEIGNDGKLINNHIPTYLTKYRINHFSAGVPADSAIMLVHCPSEAITLPVNLAGSKIVASVAATAETVLTIKKGATTIGTATFAAAGTVATLAVASAVSVSTSEVLSIVNQANNDNTLANVSFALVGVVV